MKSFLTKHKRKLITLVILILVGLSLYALIPGSITINPVSEQKAMDLLNKNKSKHTLSAFDSDGCSGNVSNLWKSAVVSVSAVVPELDKRYKDAQNIPFEYACVLHDKAYHLGEGGFVGRIRADNSLRTAIIEYGITHTDDIKKRTGIKSDEIAIVLYESIAEVIYRGVRLGGAPCTGESYAWGYGYNGGVCEE